MRFPPVHLHLLIEWLNGLARVPIGGRPVVRTGVQVSVFSGRLHRIPRTYPRFWAGLLALKLPIYPFFGPAYRPGPPRFIRTAGRPLCVYSGVLGKWARDWVGPGTSRAGRASRLMVRVGSSPFGQMLTNCQTDYEGPQIRSSVRLCSCRPIYKQLTAHKCDPRLPPPPPPPPFPPPPPPPQWGF